MINVMDVKKNQDWEKEDFIKETITKNKFLKVSMFIFGICITANVALMYSFFKIILTV